MTQVVVLPENVLSVAQMLADLGFKTTIERFVQTRQVGVTYPEPPWVINISHKGWYRRVIIKELDDQGKAILAILLEDQSEVPIEDVRLIPHECVVTLDSLVEGGFVLAKKIFRPSVAA